MLQDRPLETVPLRLNAADTGHFEPDRQASAVRLAYAGDRSARRLPEQIVGLITTYGCRIDDRTFLGWRWAAICYCANR